MQKAFYVPFHGSLMALAVPANLLDIYILSGELIKLTCGVSVWWMVAGSLV